MADPPRDDAALLQRFQTTQDEAAFGELVRRHGPLVWGVCRRRLDRLEDAEDAFQTTFLILAIKAGTIRHPEALAGWLHRTATRVARRVATKSPPKPGDEQHDAGLDALAEITKREMIAAVDDELQALPGQYRDVLVLFHLEGLPRQEVASRLGVSEPTIKARLSRGRSLLRSRLARRGVALPLLLPLATDPLPAGAAESATRLGTTFGRTRVTPGDLLTTTLTQGAHPMLSLITGKTGLAVLAVCLGLTVVWAVRDPLQAGDEEGRGVPVIDTELDAPSQTNDSSLALLDDGAATSNPTMPPEIGDSDQPKQNAAQTQLKPADPIRLNVEERKIFEELSNSTRVEFTGIPLRDALTALAQQHEINIILDQVAIEEESLSVDNNVDMFINGITLGSALDLLLEPEGLAYHVEDEVLKITARDALGRQVATRAYYIPAAGDATASAELAERLGNLLIGGRHYRLFREPDPGKHPMDQEPEQPAPVAPEPVIEIFGDRLIIAGTLEDHKNLQDILRLIYEEPVDDAPEPEKKPVETKETKKMSHKKIDISAEAVEMAFGNEKTQQSPNELAWQPFSTARVTELISERKTILVDFTADWCLNCKINEKNALNTEETKALIENHNIVPLMADFTNESEEIQQWLDRFGAVGIPLTLIFPGDNPDEPVVLDGLYSQSTLIESLEKAVGDSSASGAASNPTAAATTAAAPPVTATR